MNTLQKIELENKHLKESRKIIPYEEFHASFLNGVKSHPERFTPDVFTENNGKFVPHVRYGRGSRVSVLSEPIRWISLLTDHNGGVDSCSHLMTALIDGRGLSCEDLKGTDPSEIIRSFPLKDGRNGIWFNSTDEGICLRPGYMNGSVTSLTPVILGDNNVHMLIAGRTGGGKSATLDSLLLNAMTEYPPWELSFVLIDFKKVELSRYMNKTNEPHVRILAATDEKSYVISVLKYLKDCMMARQELFNCLGVRKISEFRQKYHAVLPRILVVCDEFQQLFQNNTPRQNNEIQNTLNALVRMGRNSGIHLLFCSQDMSQTISARLLSGFKARCALPCSSEVSSEIIGNNAASSIETGTLIANCCGGDMSANIYYRVPLASDGSEDSDGYFQRCMQLFAQSAEKTGFRPVQKYYRQEEQKNLDVLVRMLEHPAVVRERDALLKTSPQYRELITLGAAVIYRTEEYDLEQLALSADGLNQNILAVCDLAADCAYLENLLCENLITSSRFITQKNILFDCSVSVQSAYRLADHINAEVYSDFEDFDMIRTVYAKRRSFLKACRQETIASFIKVYTDSIGSILQENRKYQEYQAVLTGLFQDTDITGIPDRCKQITEQNSARGPLVQPLLDYWRFRNEKQSAEKILPFLNIWISGAETLERLPGWFSDVLKYSAHARMCFLIFSASSDIPLGELYPRCDYIFMCTNNENAYQRCHMSLYSQSDIVVNYRIQSRDQEGSFKKYRTQYETKAYPSISFDRIFGLRKG